MICSGKTQRGHQSNKVINMKELCSILWKIGSSVVITVPAEIAKNLDIGANKTMLSIALDVGGDSIKFIARPWKCGGSFVATIPSTYVELYNLNTTVKDKVAVPSVIRAAKVGVNNRIKHGNTT